MQYYFLVIVIVNSLIIVDVNMNNKVDKKYFVAGLLRVLNQN